MSDSKENSQDKKESGEENKGPTGVEANANTLTEINNEGGDDKSGDVPPINTNTDIVINLEEKDNNQPPAATRANSHPVDSRRYEWEHQWKWSCANRYNKGNRRS